MIFTLRVAGASATLRILHLLYDGSTVFLDRKKALASLAASWAPTTAAARGLRQRKLTPKEEEEILRSPLTQRALAEKFKMSKSGISLIRRRALKTVRAT